MAASHLFGSMTFHPLVGSMLHKAIALGLTTTGAGALAVGLVSPHPTHAAELTTPQPIEVINPSFELPLTQGWQTSAGDSATLFTPSEDFFGAGVTVPDGDRVVKLLNGTVFQELSEVLEFGVTYTLNVDLGRRPLATFPAIGIQLCAGGSLLGCEGASLLAQDSPITNSGGGFFASTITFTLDDITSSLIGQPLGIRLFSGPRFGESAFFDNIRFAKQVPDAGDDGDDGAVDDADGIDDGAVDDIVDGSDDGTVDGTADSSDDGAVDDTVDGNDDGAVDSTADGNDDSTDDGTVDGTADSSDDGAVDDTVDGSDDGAVDSTTDGNDDGTVDGTADSSDDGTVDDIVDGSDDGAVDSTTDGNDDGTVDGTADSSDDGTVDDIVDGSDDGAVDSTADGNDDGTVDSSDDGAVDSTADGNDDGTVDGTADSSDDGTVDDIVDGSDDGAVDSTDDGTVDGTDDKNVDGDDGWGSDLGAGTDLTTDGETDSSPPPVTVPEPTSVLGFITFGALGLGSWLQRRRASQRSDRS